ncbi:hypothetical protein BDN72DRAFT_494843 [Pluteus cervinus]|uniref:Uncharacterized protein n=1 Tax=Pluteus cervinus TaxID=181527 RepID=A0ACD3A625_9AGAR|nr:hypothetical protein BDN72DRAFT_494843 [Pluteus cervinus]
MLARENSRSLRVWYADQLESSKILRVWIAPWCLLVLVRALAADEIGEIEKTLGLSRFSWTCSQLQMGNCG